MRVLAIIATSLTLAAVAVGCSHHEEPDPLPLQPGQAASTEGTDSLANTIDPILADSVERVEGAGMSMRYDRAGTMVSLSLAGAVKFVEIDTGNYAKVTCGEVSPDSTIASLVIDYCGTPVAVKRARMVSRTDTHIWLRAITPSLDTIALHLPCRVDSN